VLFIAAVLIPSVVMITPYWNGSSRTNPPRKKIPPVVASGARGSAFMRKTLPSSGPPSSSKVVPLFFSEGRRLATFLEMES
jgi:hypothetical protein